jgi:SAM-dependent methyltransferase
MTTTLATRATATEPDLAFFTPQLMFSSPSRVREIYEVGLRPFRERFQGARVVDLACNIGYWSHTALALGAAHVTAIDFHPETLAKARANLKALGAGDAQVTFVQEDTRDAVRGLPDRFDIALCMGLLYHFVDPVGFLWDLAAMEAEWLFIDTAISFRSEPILEYVVEKTGAADNASGIKRAFPGRNVVGVPSEALIWKMLIEFGYDPATPNLAPIGHTGYSPNGANRKLIQWWKKNPSPRYHKWRKSDAAAPTDWVLRE